LEPAYAVPSILLIKNKLRIDLRVGHIDQASAASSFFCHLVVVDLVPHWPSQCRIIAFQRLAHVIESVALTLHVFYPERSEYWSFSPIIAHHGRDWARRARGLVHFLRTQGRHFSSEVWYLPLEAFSTPKPLVVGYSVLGMNFCPAKLPGSLPHRNFVERFGP